MKMLVVLMVALVAVRGRPADDIGEPDEASVRAAMLKATRGLNQTQADVVLSTLETAHVSNTSTSDPTYQAQQRSHRESQDKGHSDRSKEIRINEIKNRVLGYLERFGRRNTTGIGPQQPSRPLFHDAYSASTPEVFAEKLQSFYPSCELPRNTDEEVWSDGKSLNLLFDVSYPTPAEGSVATIITAKLRLYKLAQANVTQLKENCPTPETEEKSETDNTIVDEQADQAVTDEEIVTSTENQPSPDDQGLLSDQSQQPEEPVTVEEDTQVRVSVYWYTRSVKKHRVKRKLLDSKMFSVYGDEWAEFNIRPAVRAWRDVRKNFGLVVEVEDEDGQLLDASKYFTTMNCTNEASATVRPIPGFLVETARVLLLQNGANVNAEDGPDSASTMALNPIYLDAFLFPMIDICTVELAQPKVMYERSHYSLGGQQPANTAEPEPEPVSQQDQDEEFFDQIPYAVSYTSHNFDHPHRHNHHHEVQNDSEQESNDWTHDFRRHIINKTVIMQAAQIKQALNSQGENSRLL